MHPLFGYIILGAVLSSPLIFDRRAAPMHVPLAVYCASKLQEPCQHPPPYKKMWFHMCFAPLLRQRWRMVLPGCLGYELLVFPMVVDSCCLDIFGCFVVCCGFPNGC